MALLVSSVAAFIICTLSSAPGVLEPTKIPLLLAECGGEYSPYQQWFLYNQTNDNNYTSIRLKQYPNTCIDCNKCQLNKIPYSLQCSGSKTQNQFFNLNHIPSKPSNTFQFQSISNGSTCIEINAPYQGTMQYCNSSNLNQLFTLNLNSNSYITSYQNSSLCLTVGLFNCSMSPFKTYPYCNQQLPTYQRVNDLLSRMTLDEKIINLQHVNYGVRRLGIPSTWYGEALHGVACDCGLQVNNTDGNGLNTACPTSFPHALMLGATFNRSLWRDVGKAISTEARGFANQNIAGLFKWAPDINLFRDPRWYVMYMYK